MIFTKWMSSQNALVVVTYMSILNKDKNKTIKRNFENVKKPSELHR